MYFFVKDNNMADISIDLLKLLKSKKATEEFVNILSREYVNFARRDILDTIRQGDVKDNFLSELKEDTSEEWLKYTVLSVFQSSAAVSKMQSVARRIFWEYPGGSAEFLEKFEKETKVTALTRVGGRDTERAIDAIPVEINLKPGNSVEAVDAYRLLSVAFHGGDVIPESVKLPDGEESIIVNSQPGFNDALVQDAADRIRDFFVKKYTSQLGDQLQEEIKKNLKKFKS